MKNIGYDRDASVKYALKWALGRNKKYIDFTNLGGDCTNFVSQCLYAGSGVMNFTPIYGWYYISSYDRSPSWSGVNYLYDFLVSNKDVGPFGSEISADDIMPGDIIQLYSLIEKRFYHSLFVVSAASANPHGILVCAHTDNARLRPLSTYSYDDLRFIHIEGVNKS
ncbi:MAG: amidase [Ruminococcaceae bacterium]|nr:amidase [Oscillospiraceae bacterium]